MVSDKLEIVTVPPLKVTLPTGVLVPVLKLLEEHRISVPLATKFSLVLWQPIKNFENVILPLGTFTLNPNIAFCDWPAVSVVPDATKPVCSALNVAVCAKARFPVIAKLMNNTRKNIFFSKRVFNIALFVYAHDAKTMHKIVNSTYCCKKYE